MEVTSPRQRWLLRAMTLMDVPHVVRIEQHSFALPWSQEAFEREVTCNPFAYYVVVEQPSDGDIVGFGGVWIVTEEAHVTNIAIMPEVQRQGLGLRVLECLRTEAERRGAVTMSLEVRPSNEGALQLYRRCRFAPAGVRKRYYADNGEDALVLVCSSVGRTFLTR